MFRFKKGDIVSIVGIDKPSIIDYEEINSGYDGYRLVSGDWVYDDLCSLFNKTKKITLEELRAQFEREAFQRSKPKMRNSYMYLNDWLKAGWEGYLLCAKANNILSED